MVIARFYVPFLSSQRKKETNSADGSDSDFFVASRAGEKRVRALVVRKITRLLSLDRGSAGVLTFVFSLTSSKVNRSRPCQRQRTA
jgi:hypothetical protein